MVTVLISRHGEGTMGRPTSASSMSAGRVSPSRPRNACCTAVPVSIAMRAAPMLLEYMKISGTESQRFFPWKSLIVKRAMRIGLLAS